ncbi:MAG: MFS transporter [Gammaproteobacteria bacterium]
MTSAKNQHSFGGKDAAAVIIAVGAVYICITMGLRQGFGLYLAPFTEMLGINRGDFAFAIAMQNIVWGLASPVFGMLADKRGPVLAAALGGVFYFAGMLLMAMASSGGALLMAQMLIGAGMAGAGFSVILGAVGKAAKPSRRSFSLAIVSAAGSLGQFLFVPVAQLGLSTLGARDSLLMLSFAAALLIFFAPLLKTKAQAAQAAAGVSDFSAKAVLRTALSSRSYVLLLAGFFVCGFQVVFIATHLPAYVADAGLSAQAAANALALVGLFNIAGTMFCGWAGDRFSKKNSLAVFYLCRSAVIVLFLLAPKSDAAVMLFGAAIGFFWLGTVPLTSGLVAVFFGTRQMSMLYGVVFVSHQVGSALGAYSGGAFFDATGSYNAVWFICIALGVLAAVLHYPIVEKADDAFARRFAT